MEGNSRFATAIRFLTQSTWSHAALYIGEEPLHPGGTPQPMLIDVDVDVERGVQRIPLAEYSCQHTSICRPQGLSAEVLEQLVDFMRSRLGYS